MTLGIDLQYEMKPWQFIDLFFPMIYVLLIYDNFEFTNEIFDRTITLKNIKTVEDFTIKLKTKIIDFVLKIIDRPISVKIRKIIDEFQL